MKLDQLKAIAQAANQGRWYWHEDGNMYADPAIDPFEFNETGTAIIQTDDGFYGPEERERAYIASFNPATALALLVAAEALQDIIDTGFAGGPQGSRARKALTQLEALE